MKSTPVHHEPEAHKFYTWTDEGEAYLLYSSTGNILDLYRTFVPKALREKGIAGELVKAALTYARKNGFKVHPSCPYVAAYMERHEEDQDLKA